MSYDWLNTDYLIFGLALPRWVPVAVLSFIVFIVFAISFYSLDERKNLVDR